MHLRVCLKSNTSIRPLSVPMQMSPFAVMTVGAPMAGAPSKACALFDGFHAKRCVPSARNCVHRNTSRTSEGRSCPCPCPFATSYFSAPPGSAERCAEEDEPGESVEKLDGTGEGDMPRRAECVLVAVAVAEGACEACGM